MINQLSLVKKSSMDDPVLNDVPTNADGLLALDTVRRTLETYDNVDEFFF
jgi:hypothetical protein